MDSGSEKEPSTEPENSGEEETPLEEFEEPQETPENEQDPSEEVKEFELDEPEIEDQSEEQTPSKSTEDPIIDEAQPQETDPSPIKEAQIEENEDLQTDHGAPEEPIVVESLPNEDDGDNIRAPLIKKKKKRVKRSRPRPKKDRKGRKIYSSGNIGWDDGGFVQKTLFMHFNKIIKRGNKTPYSFDMLYELDDELLYADYIKFEKFFNKNHKKYSKDVLGAVYAYNRRYMWMINFLFVFKYFLECSFPLLLKQLLNWIELEDNGDLDMNEGLLYAALISLFIMLRSYCGLLADYIIEIVNGRIKNNLRVSHSLFQESLISLQGLIVNKVSSLPPGARKYVDIARITNHMIVDMTKITYYTIFRPNILVSDIQLKNKY